MNRPLLTAVDLRTWSLPRFDSGALSVLKWLGLVLMTVDHIDAFLYQRELATQLGRLVFPIFGFVLAYNLARPVVDEAARARLLRRLLVIGLLALPFHAQLATHFGGWWPLNIMATFAAVVAIVDRLERGDWPMAIAIFLGAGAVVEYWWPGLAFCLACWWLYRTSATGPDVAGRLVAVVGACAALVLANGSHTALVALPVIVLASGLHVRVPRLQWAFYAYYPAHLALFWLLSLR